MGKFDDLVKIPDQPALRFLAVADLSLSEPVDLPAVASVGDMLQVLVDKEAYSDAIQLLAAALPVREAVWWGCLAGRDLHPGDTIPETLAAAEAWVFDPSEANLERAQAALEATEAKEPTSACANAVTMANGKVGPGLLAAVDAPVGASCLFVMSICLKAYKRAGGGKPAYQAMLVDRALDIARGGNGRIAWVPEEAAT